MNSRANAADRHDAGQDNPGSGAADLTNCDREPIHIPAAIQPHGVLLALDPETLTILQAAGDTTRILGDPPAKLLGHHMGHWFPEARVTRLRSLLATEGPMLRPLHAFTLSARHDGRPIDALVHQTGGLLVLELEPLLEKCPDDALSQVQAMLLRVQQAATPRAFCQGLADEVRRVSGFDRVMVYRFQPDGSGAVIAEARHDDAESFLGLHYPASDIPQQARALYLSNWVRLIPNTHYRPDPILPPLNPLDGSALDLSYAVTRSVSPIHLQYLLNMGVAASMSLSLVIRGELWGLIACHHRTPRFLPHRLRMACELFAQMASWRLESKVAGEEFDAHLHCKRVHEELVKCITREGDLTEGLMHHRPNLQDYIPADGVGLWLDGRFTALGRTPAANEVAALVAWLNKTAADGVYHTDRLPLDYPPAVAFADAASGLIALSVSRSPRDYVLWFRPEVVRDITWGGNPNKPVDAGSAGETLTPRISFAAWQESVKLHARPWRNVDIEAAKTLRLSLLEVVLQRIDQVAREREVARLKQEALTAELDRRLEQWQAVAAKLKEEAERRAVLEAELSQVLRSTVEDQEAERRRIARELHDTLGQTLTLLQLGLDGLGRCLPQENGLQTQLVALKGLAKGVGADINRLAWEIRPTALDDLGLETAIRHLTEIWAERSNLPIRLHLALNDRRLDPAVETTLYRVLQEALNNIVRHAEATRVGVLLEANEKEVRMIVEDDGRGFTNGGQPDDKPAKRLGLLGIRERLSLVCGALEVETAPGLGCTLFVRVPL
jgi:light-regulated signal transduction histidine kinase (bacteriophytochrome)